jgi:hypothetical protein
MGRNEVGHRVHNSKQRGIFVVATSLAPPARFEEVDKLQIVNLVVHAADFLFPEDRTTRAPSASHPTHHHRKANRHESPHSTQINTWVNATTAQATSTQLARNVSKQKCNVFKYGPQVANGHRLNDSRDEAFDF